MLWKRAFSAYRGSSLWVSLSYDTAVQDRRSGQADVVEIMPPSDAFVIRRFCGELPMPVIAGGLIETKEEIIEVLGQAVSRHQPAKRNVETVGSSVRLFAGQGEQNLTCRIL
jgi:hypothetical protein